MFCFRFSQPFPAVTKNCRTQHKDGFLSLTRQAPLRLSSRAEAEYHGREHVVGHSYSSHGGQEEELKMAEGGLGESKRGKEVEEEEGSERRDILAGQTP